MVGPETPAILLSPMQEETIQGPPQDDSSRMNFCLAGVLPAVPNGLFRFLSVPYGTVL